MLEANKRNLHRHQAAAHVKGAIGHVEARRVATRSEEGEHVHRNKVDNEDVATPRGHHVKVRQGCKRTPVNGSVRE